MSKPIIRSQRVHCPPSTSMPQAKRDGALAVAAINEDVQVAQMRLDGMRSWDRRQGAFVKDVLRVPAPVAHRRSLAVTALASATHCSSNGTAMAGF